MKPITAPRADGFAQVEKERVGREECADKCLGTVCLCIRKPAHISSLPHHTYPPTLVPSPIDRSRVTHFSHSHHVFGKYLHSLLLCSQWLVVPLPVSQGSTSYPDFSGPGFWQTPTPHQTKGPSPSEARSTGIERRASPNLPSSKAAPSAQIGLLHLGSRRQRKNSRVERPRSETTNPSSQARTPGNGLYQVQDRHAPRVGSVRS